MLADMRPSGDDTAIKATGEGSPRHSGARLAWERAVVSARSGGCGRWRRPGRHVCWRPGIWDKGDKQRTELYAESLFYGKKVILHGTSPYPAQTHPRRWVFNDEA